MQASHIRNWLRSVLLPIILHLALQVTTALIVLAFIYQDMRRLVDSDAAQSAFVVQAALTSAYRTSGDIGVERLIGVLNAERGVGGGISIQRLAQHRPPHRLEQPREPQRSEFRIGKHRLLIADITDRRAKVFRTVEWAMVGTLLLGLEGGLIVGVLLIRGLKRRISSVADGIQRFEYGHMEERIAHSGSGDAFDRLSALLNRTFDRVQSLMAELRAVTDALAHDIRSPVMRMRVAAETAQQGNDADMRKSLDRIIAETDGVIRMLTDALELSRTDAGMYRDQFLPVDLGAIADDLVDAFSPLAAAVGLTLEAQTSGGLIVLGHASLLSRAIANLIENAIKHSAGQGSVMVRVTDLGDQVTVAVSDQGIGISEADRPAALRRFSKLPGVSHLQGSGLGLSLVSSIVSLHWGILSLTDNDPGLIVSFAVPRLGWLHERPGQPDAELA